MESPRFSVLMANYNNGVYIKTAIESVLAQTFQEWELVIVDDASTDDSLQVVSEFVKHDSRIQLYLNDVNCGCGYTKRRCAKEASGEILAFLDSDDALVPDALAKLCQLHDRYPEHSVIYSTHHVCLENLEPLQIADYVGQVPVGDSHAAMPWTGPVISHFATFKKRLYNETEGINPSLKRAVDQDLYNRLEEVGTCLYLDEPLYYYRHNKNSISIGDNNLKAGYWNYIVFSDTYKRRKKTKERFARHLSRVELDRKRLDYFIAKAFQKAETKDWFKMYYCLLKATPAVYLDQNLAVLRIAISPIKRLFR